MPLRLMGSVRWIKKDGVFLKVDGHPMHWLSPENAPPDLEPGTIMWFTSYPPKPGKKRPVAANVAIVRNPKIR